jgi:hypothetical protein
LFSDAELAIQIFSIGCFFIFAIGLAVFIVLVSNFAMRVGRACMHYAVAIMTRFDVDLPAFLVLLAEPTEKLPIAGAINS